MEYSKIFETLLNITDQKLQDIADLLHYDKSYISKWVNAKAIPSISFVSEIHEILSDYFADRIYGTKKLNELKDILGLKFEPITRQILSKSIYNELSFAYFKVYHNCNPSPISSELDNQVIIGREKIFDFLYSLFNTELSNDKVKLYSTLPNKFLFPLISQLKKLWLFNLKVPVELNLLFEKLPEVNRKDELLFIVKSMGDLSYYDVNLYREDKKSYFDYYIYAKNKFVIFFNTFENGLPLMITFTKSKDILDAIDRSNKRVFNYSNPLLKTIDGLRYERYYYETNLICEDSMIYTSYMNACFMNSEDLKKAIVKNDIDKRNYDFIHSLIKLQNFSIKNNMHQIRFNSTALFASIEKRKLCLGPYYIQLSEDDYIKYLNKTYDEIFHNANHKYSFIDAESLGSICEDYFMSFYLNSNSFIAKKLDPFNINKFKYIISTDQSINEFFKKLFIALDETNYVKNLNLKELKNLISSKISTAKILNQ